MWQRICAAIAVGLFGAFAGSDAQANPPIEAFGNLPFISNPRLSPDGQQFAVLKPINGKEAVVVYPVTGSAEPKLFNDTTWNILDVRWANNDRFIVTVKSPGVTYTHLQTWYRTFLLSTKGGDPVLPFEGVDGMSTSISTAFIAGIDLNDPTHISMPFHGDLYRVDVNSGEREWLARNRGQTYDWIVDGHSHVLGRLDFNSSNRRMLVFAKDDGTWDSVTAFADMSDGLIPSLGTAPDKSGFVYLAADDGDKRGLMQLDLAKGATPAELYFDPHYDVEAAITDEWTNQVTGAAVVTDREEDRYLDPQRQALQARLQAAFPGLTVHIASTDAARDRAIVETSGPRSPPAYYICDLVSGKTYRIASAYPGLRESDLGEMKPYPYAARDGLPIAAYLTLPPGKPAKNLPTIVMPHGGPDARDAIGFDWWVQFLANRGYAVLQPNYRGSTGYGKAFTTAGMQQWGLKMQDDISDGVKKLIADGIADPKRVCIVGASFGGYAALVGATRTPELYACAVSVAGLSDLRVVATEFVPWGTPAGTPMALRMGLRSASEKRLEETSPVLHADSVRCPILLMHGKYDTTVPIQHSEAMRDALMKAGANVKLIEFDSDDHYFTLAATRIRMLSELEKFLSQTIGN